MNKKWIGRLTCLLLATLVLYILTVYVLVPNCYTAFGDYEHPGEGISSIWTAPLMTRTAS